MTNHVIYVPGLGDSRTYQQDKMLRLWKFYGLRPYFFALGWADNEGFEPKLQRLLNMIDSLQKNGDSVSLVGVSAGGSAVINAYALRKNLKAVICIAGKINNPQTIGRPIYDKNPAFKESVYRVDTSLSQLNNRDRAKILSLYALADLTVPPKDAKIKGATNKTIVGLGHISAIFIAVIFYGRTIARFIRSQGD